MTDIQKRSSTPPSQRFETERRLRTVVLLRNHLGPVDDDLAQAFLASVANRPLAEIRAEANLDWRQEEAQDHAFQALAASNDTEAVTWARQALALDPNCLDARTTLAGRGSQPNLTQVDQLRTLLAETQAQVDGFSLKAFRGSLWNLLSLRPYMRLRACLAFKLATAGRKQQAGQAWEALLDLDPRDPLEVRFPLLQLYAAQAASQPMAALLHRLDQDDSALTAWLRPLPPILSGDAPNAIQALERARARNAHIEALLVSKAQRPRRRTPTRTPGSLEEALETLPRLTPIWTANRDALVWLMTHPAQTEASR